MQISRVLIGLRKDEPVSRQVSCLTHFKLFVFSDVRSDRSTEKLSSQ